MSPGKHDPAPLKAYFNAHENRMDQLRRGGVVVRDGLKIRPRGDAFIIAGDVEIDGGVVQVRKEVRKVDKPGNTARVQTHAYSYNVSIPGSGVIVRHDGPDHHKTYHHRHDYDPPGRIPQDYDEVEVEWDDVPTLAEVIEAAHERCNKNRSALEELDN